MPALLRLIATLVDACGTVILLVAIVTGTYHYLRQRGEPEAADAVRIRLAQGFVFALSFKSGAGIIRTVLVGSWHEFASVLFIIALRFFLGRVLKNQVSRRETMRKTLLQHEAGRL